VTLRFGTDGVRGRVPDELSPDFAAALGRVAVEVLGGTDWIVGVDPRASSPQLAAAFGAGLLAGGAQVHPTGVLPTPALAWLSQQRNAPAAMITASHNPWHDNGIKIFAAGGTKLTDDVEESIEDELHRVLGTMSAPSMWDVAESNAAAGYIDHITAMCSSLDGLRVVLDCANGAMFHVAPRAFRDLGADVLVINDQPNGRNINDHCGATHPAELQKVVVDEGADLGLAFDGDGDRLIAVDHHGTIVDGDRLIALAALHLRDQGSLRHNTVVVTVMSNLGFHQAMAASGIEVVTTAVGDRYVLEALEQGGFSIGGEQSGHIIYRDLATTGDGLLAGMRLAEYVREADRSLADLAGRVMRSYPQTLVNVRVAERHPHVADELADEIDAAETALDGQGRVLLRPSGTEPLIRVMVEAATHEQAERTAASLADVVQRRFA
jgi:phosphoglucosamine mutase